MERGYEAEVYGHPVAELADRVIEIGRAGLSPDEQRYLDPLAALVADRTTLADIAERG